MALLVATSSNCSHSSLPMKERRRSCLSLHRAKDRYSRLSSNPTPPTLTHEHNTHTTLLSIYQQEDLIDYCIRPKRTATEVFRDFPGIKLPLEYLLDVLPLIRARSFSISSSWKVRRQNMISFYLKYPSNENSRRHTHDRRM